jgi:tape measure domain-containing protein
MATDDIKINIDTSDISKLATESDKAKGSVEALGAVTADATKKTEENAKATADNTKKTEDNTKKTDDAKKVKKSLSEDIEALTQGMINNSRELLSGQKGIVSFGKSTLDLVKSVSPMNLALGASAALMAKVATSGWAEAGRIDSFRNNLNSITTSFGTQMKVLDQLHDSQIAASFGYEAAENAGLKLAQSGMSLDKLGGTLDMLGDLALGNQQKFEGLTDTFVMASNKGVVSYMDLVKIQKQGVPVLDDLASHYGVTTDKLQEMVGSGQVGFGELEESLNRIATTNDRFTGSLATNTDDMAGTLALYKNQFKEFAGNTMAVFQQFAKVMAASFGPMIQYIVEVSRGFRNMTSDANKLAKSPLVKFLQGTVKVLTEVNKVIIDTVYKGIKSLIDVFLELGGDIMSSFKDAFSGLSGVVGEAGGGMSVFANIVEFVVDAIKGAVEWFASMVTVGIQLGAVVTGGLVKAFNDFRNSTRDASGELSGIGIAAEGAKNVFLELIRIIRFLPDFMIELGKDIPLLTKLFIQNIANIPTQIGYFMKKMVANFQIGFYSIFAVTKGFLMGFVDLWIVSFKNVGSMISKFFTFDNIMKMLSGDVSAVFDVVKSEFTAGMGRISDSITGSIAGTQSAIANYKEKVYGDLGEIDLPHPSAGDDLKDAIAAIIERARARGQSQEAGEEDAEDYIESMQNAFSNSEVNLPSITPSEEEKTGFNKWLDDTKNAFKDLSNTIGKTMGGLLNDVMGSIFDGINEDMQNAMNDMDRRHKSALDLLTGRNKEAEAKRKKEEDERIRRLNEQHADGLVTTQQYQEALSDIEKERGENDVKTKEQLDAELLALEIAQAQEKDELARKQFEASKKQRSAQIWVDLGTAIMGIWAGMSSIPIVGPILAGVQTGVATGIAIAQQARIAKEQFVPALATGGTIGTGGLTMVGERGRELVNLPSASTVIDNTTTEQLLRNAKSDSTGGDTVNINITVNGNVDPAVLARAIKAELDNRGRQLRSA